MLPPQDILVKEFPAEYAENGVRNWLKVQQDEALIKTNLKSTAAVPSCKMVKSTINQKYLCRPAAWVA